MSRTMCRRWGLAFFAVAIFALALARYLGLAERVQLNTDEGAGLAEALLYSYAELLRHGPTGELNASPLHYLFDRAWMELFGLQAHWHYNLNVYFRFLPSLWGAVSAAAVFAFWVVAAAEAGLPILAGLAVGVGAALAMMTNLMMAKFGFLTARPYALWLALSHVQLLVLMLSLRKPRPRGVFPFLCALNCVMAVTTYTSAAQAAAGALLRLHSHGISRARLLRETLPELVPAGLVALYYYQFGRWQGELGPESPLNIWLIALSHGVFSPAMAWFRQPGVFFSEMEPASRWLAAAGLALFLALPWRGAGTWQRALRFARGLTALGLPITVLALYSARSFSAKYLLFLYPGLALAVPALAILLATVAGRRWRHGAIGVAGLFLALQAAYRLPVIWRDMEDTWRAPRCVCLHRSKKAPSCPERIDEMRVTLKGSLDSTRMNLACLTVTEPPPAETCWPLGEGVGWSCD